MLQGRFITNYSTNTLFCVLTRPEPINNDYTGKCNLWRPMNLIRGPPSRYDRGDPDLWSRKADGCNHRGGMHVRIIKPRGQHDPTWLKMAAQSTIDWPNQFIKDLSVILHEKTRDLERIVEGKGNQEKKRPRNGTCFSRDSSVVEHLPLQKQNLLVHHHRILILIEQVSIYKKKERILFCTCVYWHTATK